MSEFLSLVSPEVARDRLLNLFQPEIKNEKIATSGALNRIIAEDIFAPHPLPEFSRSTVDGYAVRAENTYGASDAQPMYLEVVGDVPMGKQPGFRIDSGQCAFIHTGGMLPTGANAVVMVENTQKVGSPGKESHFEIEIFKQAAVSENAIPVGEDVKTGELVINSGTKLRPAEIGGLMALGYSEVLVAKQPVVGILSNGDEIVPPETRPAPGQVRDINLYTLSSLVEQAGGSALKGGIIPDQVEQLEAAAAQLLKQSDMLLITAGSSASSRDHTATVINRLGSPGILVHGVNIHPGKPTILAICDQKPVIGLPGNPVSALVIASLFVLPVIKKFLGERTDHASATISARLTTNIPSQAGREDWIAVRLFRQVGDLEWKAEPIFGRSNLIFTLVRADGLICIGASVNGLAAGEIVEVNLF